MDIEIIKNRKGVQKAVDIPSEVLSLLNEGRIETVNLTEWLAVDHSQLCPKYSTAKSLSMPTRSLKGYRLSSPKA